MHKADTAGGADFAATGRMSVPGCWDMLPKWLCKRGTGLYRRTFTLDKPVENAWILVDGVRPSGNAVFASGRLKSYTKKP